MLTFKYDILLDQEDICDREQETASLLYAAKHNKKTVLLAPRRYGKTSLLKNVVGKKLAQSKPKKLVIFIDLMDVTSLHSIAARIEHGIAQALLKTFTIQTITKRFTDILKNFSISIDINNYTTLTFKNNVARTEVNIMPALDSLYKITEQQSAVLILDEFQDIARIEEAQAIFRSTLQKMGNTAIFILGSKQHIIQDMLTDNRAPLFHFGDEMYLPPIAESEWIPYFKERLQPVKTSITDDALHYLAEKMCHVPNAICEVGAWIQDYCRNRKIAEADIDALLNDMVAAKQSYAYRLLGFTLKEKFFLQAVAKENFVLEPQSTNFVSKSNIAKSSIAHMLNKFRDNGILEHEPQKGWRLSDSIFAHYLCKTIL